MHRWYPPTSLLTSATSYGLVVLLLLHASCLGVFQKLHRHVFNPYLTFDLDLVFYLNIQKSIGYTDMFLFLDTYLKVFEQVLVAFVVISLALSVNSYH